MLPDAPSICRLHLDFMKWADNLVMQMARSVDPATLERDCGVSFGSILGTVQHIYRAERVWYRRVNGEHALQIAAVAPPTLDELRAIWPEHHEEWRRWAAELNSDGWFRGFSSPNAAGVVTAPLTHWQIVLHVVNHGSYHRGQVTSMVKQSGFPVVSSDMSAYYRSLATRTTNA
jgi:uncharacterized damage-inducible protein DinB